MGDLHRAWASFLSRPADERRALLRRALDQIRRGGIAGALGWARRGAAYVRSRDRYHEWCRTHTPDASALAAMESAAESWPFRPTVSILTAVYDTDPQWLSAAADSVLAQSYPHWEWCVVDDGSTRSDTRQSLDRVGARDSRIRVRRTEDNRGISAASNRALEIASGEFIALLDHDDVLLPHALHRIVERLNGPGPRPDVVYSDEDKLDRSGLRCDPYFKPAWSPDLLRSSMYACHLLMLRRALVEQVGGFRSAFDFAQDYDLLLRVVERTDHVSHVPDVLYHWRKTPASAASSGIAKPRAHEAGARALQAHLDRQHIPGHVLDAGSPGLYRVKYAIAGAPLVSVVVLAPDPTATPVSRTLRALDEVTAYRRFEIVVVSSAAVASRHWPAGVDLQDVQASGPFDLGGWISQGARATRGEHLLVLHEGVEPAAADWMESMLELSAQPWIGAVGAKLVDRTGRVTHIGLVVDPTRAVGVPFGGHRESTIPYYAGSHCIRNRTAVSAACLMTRRTVFDRVGGFAEGWSGLAASLDYGLRVAEAGLRVVFTPYARLTQVDPRGMWSREVAPAERTRLHARWGERAERDALENPNLSDDMRNLTGR